MSQRDFLQFLNGINDISPLVGCDKKSISLILFEACKLAKGLEEELSKIDSYRNWYQIIKYQLGHPLSTFMALKRQDQFIHERRKTLIKKLNDIISTIGSIMIKRKNGLPIVIHDIKINGSILRNDKPWWIRYENAILKSLIIFGGIFAIQRTNIDIFNYRTLSRILENVYMTITSYINIWIFTPLSEIWNMVSYSRDISGLARRTSTLTEDIQALNEMIIDYTKTNTINNNSNVSTMKTVMEAYRENIKAPIRNLLRGDLLQLLLIQAQQAKVELETAMAALDKLLKSNKLNFELLALIPAVGLFWIVTDGAWSIWKWLLGRSSRQISAQLRENIHEFEACLDGIEEEDSFPPPSPSSFSSSFSFSPSFCLSEGRKIILIFKMFMNLQSLKCIDHVRDDLASLAIHKTLDQRWIIYRIGRKLSSFPFPFSSSLNSRGYQR
jgi:hypothetical protein